MVINTTGAMCTSHSTTFNSAAQITRHPFITQLQPLIEGQIQFAGVLKMNFYFNQLEPEPHQHETDRSISTHLTCSGLHF